MVVVHHRVHRPQAGHHYERACADHEPGQSAVLSELATHRALTQLFPARFPMKCHAVAFASLAGRVRRAVPPNACPMSALRCDLARRNQARWLPGHRPQGRQTGAALQPSGQRNDLTPRDQRRAFEASRRGRVDSAGMWLRRDAFLQWCPLRQLSAVASLRKTAEPASHFGTHANTTLVEIPWRCGRKLVRLSFSKLNVPPGLRA